MEWFPRREKDGNRLLKGHVFSMEHKMAAGAFGHARNYGWDGPFKILKEGLSVLMLCAPVFTLIIGSSALLGCPCCGFRSGCRYLPYSIHFSEFTIFFARKQQKYSKSAIFVWYDNGCRWLLDAQSKLILRAQDRVITSADDTLAKKIPRFWGIPRNS